MLLHCLALLGGAAVASQLPVMEQQNLFSSPPEKMTNVLLNTLSGDNGGGFSTTAGGYDVSKPAAAINLLQQKDLYKILPRNQVQTNMIQSSAVTDIFFDIPPNQVDEVDGMYLTFNIANGHTGTTGTFVDGFQFLDYVTVSLNNEEMQTIYPHAMRNDLILSSSENKLESLLPNTGISTTDYSANLSVPPSGNTTIFLPIHNCIASANLPLWRTETQFRLTFRFNCGPRLQTGGPAIAFFTVTASSMELWVTGKVYDANMRRSRDRELEANGPKTFRYLDQSRSQLNLGNITSGTVVTTPFQESGCMCFGYLHLQQTNPTGTQIYDSATITTFDFLDNNKPVLWSVGDNNYSSQFMRVKAQELWVNTSPINQRGLYYFSASTDPISDLNNGSNHGYLAVKGKSESWRLNGATTSSAILTTTTHYYSHVDIDYATKKWKVYRKQV